MNWRWILKKVRGKAMTRESFVKRLQKLEALALNQKEINRMVHIWLKHLDNTMEELKRLGEEG